MSRLVTNLLCLLAVTATVRGQNVAELRVPVEGQPLSANITRVLEALEFLGAPLPGETGKGLEGAALAQDADRLQELLDPHVLLVVTINPESRVKVQRGPARARLQQAGFTPALVKIINQGALTRDLRMVSPQAGQVYAGMTPLSAERMQRTHLKETSEATAARFIFRDETGHVFPPQAKRLAPDFYFQPQIYRRDGDVVLLPPGRLTVQYSRGPEYRQLRRGVAIPSRSATEIQVKLERWINPMDYGFYSGDHHIHGSGCAHYTSP